MQDFRQGLPAEKMEKIRAVVGRRADVEFVARNEILPLCASQRSNAVVKVRLVEYVVTVAFLARQPGQPLHVERARFGKDADFGNLAHSEFAVFHQQRAGWSAENSNQPLYRWRDYLAFLCRGSRCGQVE